ncbi:MAG: hypothetical protein SFU87_04120 [Chitinophagaceae bacterium]|nr:hypothetical protein [Chitinophagaceae bacterium]
MRKKLPVKARAASSPPKEIIPHIQLAGESSRSTIDVIRFKVVVNNEKLTMDVHLLNQRFVECTPSGKYIKNWETFPEYLRNEVKRKIKLHYAGQ